MGPTEPTPQILPSLTMRCQRNWKHQLRVKRGGSYVISVQNPRNGHLTQKGKEANTLHDKLHSLLCPSHYFTCENPSIIVTAGKSRGGEGRKSLSQMRCKQCAATNLTEHSAHNSTTNTPEQKTFAQGLLHP